jgi:ribosomal protein S18 acetylase RimI-like enzyme
VTDSPFVPVGFEPPRTLSTESFVLEPLGAEHNRDDYDAWTSSIEHIRRSPGFAASSWPREMTLEENRRDLQRHADDFVARTGFTYTVLDRSSRAVIGCVYIYPVRDGAGDASVRSWVRADRAELDRPLRTAVSAWLAEAWPFARVEYAAALQVRDAVASDAGAISGLGRIAFPSLHAGHLAPEAIEAIIEQTYSPDGIAACIDACVADPGSHFLVAERDGDLVGYLHYDTMGEPELHRIYVDPEQKRGGIGGALISELHARLEPGNSYVLLVIEANPAAIAFYERHGLREEERFANAYPGVELPPGSELTRVVRMRYTKPA